jgi:hypothetical protein
MLEAAARTPISRSLAFSLYTTPPPFAAPEEDVEEETEEEEKEEEEEETISREYSTSKTRLEAAQSARLQDRQSGARRRQTER